MLDRLWTWRNWRWPGSTDLAERSVSAAWQHIVDQLVASRSRTWTGLAGSTTADVARRQSAASFYTRYRRFMTGFALLPTDIVLGGGIIRKALSPVLQVPTPGSPQGEAIGTPDFVALIITRLEPYFPTLRRNPDNDRFRVSPLIEPTNARDGLKFMELARDSRARDTINGISAVGWDSRIIVEIDPATRTTGTLSALPSGRPLPPHPVDSLRIDDEPRSLDERQPACIRAGIDQPGLRLSDAASRMRIHWRVLEAGEHVLVVSRVGDEDAVTWLVDTGISNPRQIFPDPEVLGSMGQRLAAPGGSPDPVLVFVDTREGQLRNVSLATSSRTGRPMPNLLRLHRLAAQVLKHGLQFVL